MLNEDYKDMLRALCAEKVKFLLVGAYALAAHGYPRATMDIDFWVMPSPENATAVIRALKRFGAPLQNLKKSDFQIEGVIFQIGVAPRRIDIITAVDGLKFEDAFAHSTPVEIEGLEIHVPSIPDLIINKRASGRTKDLADVEMLEGTFDDLQTFKKRAQEPTVSFESALLELTQNGKTSTDDRHE
jgi:predicted nucleotidyltransferase